jgi:ribonuclease P protein component
MKRSYRLRRPDQFRRARREGRVVTSPLLTLNFVTGRRRRTRCGFVVTKQLGIAVQRNRAKRRVREAVRLSLASISPGYDLVFIVRSTEILNLPFLELRQLIEQLLRRAGLWRQAEPVASAPETPPQPQVHVGADDLERQ